MIILHKTNLNDGFKRVDPWRKSMEDIRIQNEAEELHITFAAGIATYPIHRKTLEEIKRLPMMRSIRPRRQVETS